jgi:hypothetical protein
VPKLIDDKRKHLQKTLPARQRDALLLEDAKEDKFFRRDLTDAFREIKKCIAEVFQGFTQAVVQMSAALGKSLVTAAQSSNMPPSNSGHPMMNPAAHGNFPADPNLFEMAHQNTAMQQTIYCTVMPKVHVMYYTVQELSSQT